MKPLSINDINRLQAENERLKKFDILNDLIIVFSGALLGTIFGQLIVRLVYAIVDAILR